MSQNVVGPGSSYGGQTVITYVGSPSVIDDVVVFADTSGLRVKDSTVKLSSKLDVDGTLPMTGILDMGTHDIKNTDDVYPNTTSVSDLGKTLKRYRDTYTDNLQGATKTRVVDSVVIGPASATSGNVASFNGTSGTTIQDTGVLAANVVQGPASAVSTHLASYNGTGGKTIQDSGLLAANVVTDSGIATSGRVATYSASKTIQDGGTLLSALLTSSTATSTYVPLAGTSSMTGDIDMKSHVVYVNDQQPVSASKFKLTGQGDAVGTTTAETNLLTGASTKGSLVYAANSTEEGFSLKLRAGVNLAYINAGNTLTFRLNNADGVLMNHVYTATNLSINSLIWIEMDAVLRGTGSNIMKGFSRILSNDVSGGPTPIGWFESVWTPSVTQTLTFTCQPNDVSSAVACETCDIESLHQI